MSWPLAGAARRDGAQQRRLFKLGPDFTLTSKWARQGFFSSLQRNLLKATVKKGPGMNARLRLMLLNEASHTSKAAFLTSNWQNFRFFTDHTEKGVLKKMLFSEELADGDALWTHTVTDKYNEEKRSDVCERCWKTRSYFWDLPVGVSSRLGLFDSYITLNTVCAYFKTRTHTKLGLGFLDQKGKWISAPSLVFTPWILR